MKTQDKKRIKEYEYDDWNDALIVIKANAPDGLYELWKEHSPIGMLKWSGGMKHGHTDNSYNWIDIDSENIVFQAVYLDKENPYVDGLVAVAFHRSGDVRGNYTDYFIFRVEDVDSLLMPFSKEDWIAVGGDVEE